MEQRRARRGRACISFDAAPSTPSLVAVAERVKEFLLWYSSIHRGAGYKSQAATAAYEQARASVRRRSRSVERKLPMTLAGLIGLQSQLTPQVG